MSAEIAKELRLLLNDLKADFSATNHARVFDFVTTHRMSAILDALDAKDKRIAALEAALEPFARRAFEFEAADDEWFCGPPVQVKHLRAARDLLPSLPSSNSNG